MLFMSIAALTRWWWNNVFFDNGVLCAAKEEWIHIDHVVGISSWSPIAVAHAFDCGEEIIDIFGDRLESNEKNFYVFKSPHFPQN